MVKFEFTMSDVDAENMLRAIHDNGVDNIEKILRVMVNPDLTEEQKEMYIQSYKDSRIYYEGLISQMTNYRIEE
jgi:hypothetical protein